MLETDDKSLKYQPHIENYLYAFKQRGAIQCTRLYRAEKNSYLIPLYPLGKNFLKMYTEPLIRMSTGENYLHEPSASGLRNTHTGLSLCSHIHD